MELKNGSDTPFVNVISTKNTYAFRKCIQNWQKGKKSSTFHRSKIFKVFLFYLKSFFRSRDNQSLDIQIQWCHEMPMHETRNTFYWTTWEVNTVSYWNFGQFVSYYKRKSFIKKSHKNCDLRTSSRPFCVCKELSTTSTPFFFINNEKFKQSPWKSLIC